NDELHAVNDAVQQRGRELDRVNTQLQSILGALQLGVVVLDGNLRVQLWNQWSENCWGLRSEEVAETHFLGLDIGLPVGQLRIPLRRWLDGGERGTMELAARDRRGRDFRCQVEWMPFEAPEMDGDAGHGVILLMDHPASDGSGVKTGAE